MKTAVSIPDDVFERAEELARRRRVSRSELYATALRALLDEDEAVTARLNAVHEQSSNTDPFIHEAARRTFAKSDW